MTVAAEKRLHTAQPSLSRQMRDLETEIGTALFIRAARGIELTAAGRVFLDHARIALFQVDAAVESARRAGSPPKASFDVGFLTGYEMEWLPSLMGILREELPTIAVSIHSMQSPDLADGLTKGRFDLAFLRPEVDRPELTYRLLRREPLVVLMPAGHELASAESVRPEDIVGQTIIGVPHSNSPALRAITDEYGARVGIDLTPDHEALNLAMAIALVASTGGVSLLPLYARNMLPPAVVSRPINGAPPVIDLVLGYSQSNRSPLIKRLLARIEELKF